MYIRFITPTSPNNILNSIQIDRQLSEVIGAVFFCVVFFFLLSRTPATLNQGQGQIDYY